MIPPKRDDVVIRAAWVLTAAASGAVRDGAVRIREGAVVDVGPAAEVLARAPEAPVVGDGTGIVAPGWVNTHTHLSEALATGMGSELTLFEWGQHIVGPVGDVITAEDAAEGTALRAVELLLSGVTCVNDMFVHANRGSFASLGVVEGLERAGLRGVVSFGAEDLADPDAGPWGGVEEILDEHHALHAAAAATELVTFRYGIGTLLGQSDALLAAGVDACERAGWSIHTHLAETREELVTAAGRWGRRTIPHAEHLGVLGRPVIAGHAVWVTAHDVDLLARREVAVAHNPVANMILGSGVCPVSALRREGIAVGIGTDGAASNDSQDMLQAVKSAALLQKVHALDPSVIDARTVFEMGTIDGARALGLSHLVGSIEPGKRADVVLYQDTVDVSVLHDPYGQLVYGASPRSVAAVWVDGRRVVDDHRCVSVDEVAQIARSRPLARHIARDSRLAREGRSVL
ncbi:amidohydrolase family protein [Microbacterium sp. SSW1-59]|uniref:amidohydrolase family protein n=1 Tax=Microbacterium xanthum TaxID=3079794 RepID=UPI002AD42657|nr:amidohydrolase family protein [Microbacterium sp. SSW1-59]MDZ8200913.1 amidohydrolase family protein [Microbacterium sp. SSW1-59]